MLNIFSSNRLIKTVLVMEFSSTRIKYGLAEISQNFDFPHFLHFEIIAQEGSTLPPLVLDTLVNKWLGGDPFRCLDRYL